MRRNSILDRLWADDRGQDLAEYGIALAVLSLAVVFTVMFIGILVDELWENGQQQVDQVVS